VAVAAVHIIQAQAVMELPVHLVHICLPVLVMEPTDRISIQVE
jgi:hypothetical protein